MKEVVIFCTESLEIFESQYDTEEDYIAREVVFRAFPILNH